MGGGGSRKASGPDLERRQQRSAWGVRGRGRTGRARSAVGVERAETREGCPQGVRPWRPGQGRDEGRQTEIWSEPRAACNGGCCPVPLSSRKKKSQLQSGGGGGSRGRGGSPAPLWQWEGSTGRAVLYTGGGARDARGGGGHRNPELLPSGAVSGLPLPKPAARKI